LFVRIARARLQRSTIPSKERAIEPQ